ncbi:hypothetical protein HanPSC8_Chr17g0758971 [Helianthus annuus]|nr:hypothetical protein HanPSC8_Chr17g0758971 [Helianthus annuus]
MEERSPAENPKQNLGHPPSCNIYFRMKKKVRVALHHNPPSKIWATLHRCLILHPSLLLC